MDLGCCSDRKNLPSSSNTFSNESDPDCIYNLDHLESLDLSLCSLSSVVGRLCSLKKLSLTWGRILEIPDSLICFTVQQINLSGTMIESIPTSIKNASELLILILVDSVKLLYIFTGGPIADRSIGSEWLYVIEERGKFKECTDATLRTI